MIVHRVKPKAAIQKHSIISELLMCQASGLYLVNGRNLTCFHDSLGFHHLGLSREKIEVS